MRKKHTKRLLRYLREFQAEVQNNPGLREMLETGEYIGNDKTLLRMQKIWRILKKPLPDLVDTQTVADVNADVNEVAWFGVDSASPSSSSTVDYAGLASASTSDEDPA